MDLLHRFRRNRSLLINNSADRGNRDARFPCNILNRSHTVPSFCEFFAQNVIDYILGQKNIFGMIAFIHPLFIATLESFFIFHLRLILAEMQITVIVYTHLCNYYIIK